MILSVFSIVFVILVGGLIVSELIFSGNPHIKENLAYTLIFVRGGLFTLGLLSIVMEFLYRS